MTITATPLSDALGAEIGGMDLSRPLDDAVQATVKAALEGKSALNVYDYALTEQVDIAQHLDDVEHAIHPAVITHHATGKKALFVSRLMTVRIEGMEEN